MTHYFTKHNTQSEVQTHHSNYGSTYCPSVSYCEQDEDITFFGKLYDKIYIKYTAPVKLIEVTYGGESGGLHINAFGSASIISHTFENGVGIICFDRSIETIGTNAFFGTDITSIKIPDSVTSISYKAFSYCYYLTSINIPDGITSIGDNAFQDCYSLTSINLPNGLTSIGNYAFSGSGLTSINIPSSVTSIGENAITYAFHNCNNLTSIIVDENNSTFDSRNNCNAIINTSDNTLLVACNNTVIPNTVTDIGGYAFYNCRNITNIIIPSSVTHIYSYAFSNCENLKTIIIPNSVTNIGDAAFINCYQLTNINIPSGITYIGYRTFCNCWKLASINIPSSVISIGAEAFKNCDDLRHVNIPSSVTSIGNYAFQYCNNLTSINISNSINNETIISDCPNIKYIYIDNNKFTEEFNINQRVYYNIENLTKLQKIVLGSHITRLSGNFLARFTNLTSITIEATTPPSHQGSGVFSDTNDCPIYVPSSSVNTYKTAWNSYLNTSRIQAIPET